MPSTQVTLASNTPSAVNIPNPTGRVVVTMISAPFETVITADGTGPVLPTNNTILSSNQSTLAGVQGAQAVVQPMPLPGSAAPGMAGPGGAGLPQIQLLSAGTPVLELVW